MSEQNVPLLMSTAMNNSVFINPPCSTVCKGGSSFFLQATSPTPLLLDLQPAHKMP